MTPVPVSVFYVRFVPLGGAGFSIDANTPHLSAEANGTFDDVVQLYAVSGASTPHRLENVHISSGGLESSVFPGLLGAGVVVGPPAPSWTIQT